MAGFLFSVFVGGIFFIAACERKYAPPPKPGPTIPDVWKSIEHAQKTLDDSLDLIYGKNSHG